MKVRPKVSQEYEARQFTKVDAGSVVLWCNGVLDLWCCGVTWCNGVLAADNLNCMRLVTADGALRIVEYGDWVLQDEEGFYVCKQDEFDYLYEEVK